MMNFIRNNRLHKDEKGAVYAEFLIAFPIMLMTFLTILQLSLLYAAKLGVRCSGHASNEPLTPAAMNLVVAPGEESVEDLVRVEFGTRRLAVVGLEV